MKTLLSIFFIAISYFAYSQQIKPVHILTENMALQRGIKIPVWCIAKPVEEIRIALGEVSGSTVTKELYVHNTYYISSSLGNDLYDGLSSIYDGIHGPWKTLLKVNSASFSAGDSILFKRGDTWNEQLTFSSSGNSTAFITYGAYGTGDAPIINCADTIAGWALYDMRNNIWVDTLNAGITNVTQVFVDGKKYTLARWPNTGWNSIDSTSSTGKYLYDTEFTQPDGYWIGCTAVWRYEWTFATATITNSSSSSNKINFATTEYIPRKNFGYYIEGKFEQLDNAGEFYYDATTHSLFISFTEDPNHHIIIEASVRSYGINATNKDYISISNLNIHNAGSFGARFSNCDHINISNCMVENSKLGGIYCDGTSNSNLEIIGNKIVQVDGGLGVAYGIFTSGISNVSISDNLVSEISSDTISPKRGIGIIISSSGNNSLISNNHVNNVSNNGITLYRESGPSILVSGNTICNCVSLLSDAGGIYMNGNKTGTIVKNNRIYDCPGSGSGCPAGYDYDTSVGIYFDETGAYGATIRNNIVSGCALGSLLHKPYQTSLYNNTFYNNRKTAICLSEKAQNQMYGNIVKNNLCYGTGNSNSTLTIRRYSTSTNAIGAFDHNLYFIPDRSNTIKYIKTGVSSTYYTLSEWKAKTGLDSGNDFNSIASDPLLSDVSNSDFHLTSSSPCIDAGKNIGLDEDFEGNSVPIGDYPDIGAYEYTFKKCQSDSIK